MSDSLNSSFAPNKWCCAVDWKEAMGDNERRPKPRSDRVLGARVVAGLLLLL